MIGPKTTARHFLDGESIYMQVKVQLLIVHSVFHAHIHMHAAVQILYFYISLGVCIIIYFIHIIYIPVHFIC